jgi:hypothetical protein
MSTHTTTHNHVITEPRLMLCQDCRRTAPFDAAGHNEEYSCACGGQWCGCTARAAEAEANHDMGPGPINSVKEIAAFARAHPDLCVFDDENDRSQHVAALEWVETWLKDPDHAGIPYDAISSITMYVHDQPDVSTAWNLVTDWLRPREGF